MRKIISIAVSLAMVIAMAAGCGNNEAYRLIKVNSFQGAVTVEREEKMDVFEGLQLVSEDSVEVGEDSLLELLADSDKHIVAEENTAFRLHSTGTETSGNITIDLIYGKSLFTIDNKLVDGSEFVVNTPNTILSVRGTSYSVEYSPDTEESRVTVFEGQVHAEWAGGEKLIEKGGEIAVTGVGENIEVKVISDGGSQPADNIPPNPGNITVPDEYDPFALEYIDMTAFGIRYSSTKEYSGIYAKEMLQWMVARKPADDDRPDTLFKNGVRVDYWALTKAEVEKEIEELSESTSGNRVNSLNYLINGDGEHIISIDFLFDNTDSGVQKGYRYYKEISDSLCLSITVCDEAQGQFLAGTDLETFIRLTENEYFTYEERISPALNSGTVDEGAWSGLLRGGADYEQLTYLLEVASRCVYDRKDDYLKDAMYWMSCESYECPPYALIEELENGSTVYDVSELNKLFSFLTDDTISEDNLNPGINRLDGERLICTAGIVDARRTPSASILKAYYNGTSEIIVEYMFNVVQHETFATENFTKTAHLIADETGKYTLAFIE